MAGIVFQHSIDAKIYKTLFISFVALELADRFLASLILNHQKITVQITCFASFKNDICGILYLIKIGFAAIK